MTLKLNDFQHGIEEVRDRVASLIGERLTGDKDDMFTGCWAGPQQVSGVIKYVLNDSCFVAGVQFDGEDVSKLTAASFMLNTTKWEWKHPSVRDDNLPVPNVLCIALIGAPHLEPQVEEKSFPREVFDWSCTIVTASSSSLQRYKVPKSVTF